MPFGKSQLHAPQHRGLQAVFTFFLHPSISFLQHFSLRPDTLLVTGIPLLLENNMDWMDGIAVAGIALFWLATWAAVLGCVKLGARQ